MSPSLAPLGSDLEAASSLAREAALARVEFGYDPASYAPLLAQSVRDGRRTGFLWLEDGAAQGIALERRANPLGLSLAWLYVRGPHTGGERYRSFLHRLAASNGPVAFVVGPLVGLSTDEEGRTMRRLGFVPFARSARIRPAERPVPSVTVPTGLRVRRVAPADRTAIVGLHERAYRDRLDRYLFFRDPDPLRDAEIAVDEILGGRWGPFRPEGSVVVEREDSPIAQVLTVEAPPGPLVVDVATDPDLRGRGLGYLALSSALASLAAHVPGPVRLNVTEGNEPALRLYDRLGFERELGPSREWYLGSAVPIPSPNP